jgi:hypothetical protein
LVRTDQKKKPNAEALYLAPNMRSVFVDESLSRITGEQFRDDKQPDVLLAVESLLKHVAAVTVHCELDNATAD